MKRLVVFLAAALIAPAHGHPTTVETVQRARSIWVYEFGYPAIFLAVERRSDAQSERVHVSIATVGFEYDCQDEVDVPPRDFITDGITFAVLRTTVPNCGALFAQWSARPSTAEAWGSLAAGPCGCVRAEERGSTTSSGGVELIIHDYVRGLPGRLDQTVSASVQH